MGGVIKGAGSFVEDVTGINVSGDSRADQALRAQQGASRDANATQLAMYNQNRADQQPWKEAGARALGQLGDSDFQSDFTMKDFQADPGYAFRMAEGQKALERSAAAKGGLNSGATLRALSRYGQDTASSEYTNAYNRFNADRDRRFGRLSQMAGIGQTAVGQLAQAGQNYGNQYGQNVMGSANAQAAAGIAQVGQTNQFIEQGSKAAGAFFSDERVKKNIEPFDAKHFLNSLNAYSFDYIDPVFGEGHQAGVMAQDLERTELGKTFVREVDGFKVVDFGRMIPVLLASLVQLQTEVSNLKKQKGA